MFTEDPPPPESDIQGILDQPVLSWKRTIKELDLLLESEQFEKTQEGKLQTNAESVVLLSSVLISYGIDEISYKDVLQEANKAFDVLRDLQGARIFQSFLDWMEGKTAHPIEALSLATESNHIDTPWFLTAVAPWADEIITSIFEAPFDPELASAFKLVVDRWLALLNYDGDIKVASWNLRWYAADTLLKAKKLAEAEKVLSLLDPPEPNLLGRFHEAKGEHQEAADWFEWGEFPEDASRNLKLCNNTEEFPAEALTDNEHASPKSSKTMTQHIVSEEDAPKGEEGDNFRRISVSLEGINSRIAKFEEGLEKNTKTLSTLLESTSTQSSSIEDRVSQISSRMDALHTGFEITGKNVIQQNRKLTVLEEKVGKASDFITKDAQFTTKGFQDSLKGLENRISGLEAKLEAQSEAGASLTNKMDRFMRDWDSRMLLLEDKFQSLSNHISEIESLSEIPKESVPHLAPLDEEVSFTCPYLESLIRNEIDIGDKNITKKDLLNLRSLFFNDKSASNPITRLEGLENALNLEVLCLDFCTIENLSPLQNLQKLSDVSLKSNQIQDIKHLKGLKQLKHLDIEANKIQDLSPLSSLYKLASLKLGKNQISDISPLRSLIQLKDLGLQLNSIERISELTSLTMLQKLDLSGNRIRDLDAIRPLSQLNELHAQGNGYQNVDSIKEMVHLETLSLGDEWVEDLSPLENLQNLKSLTISCNGNCLDKLQHLHKLETLSISAKQLDDLSPIQGLQQIKYLGIRSSAIADTTPLHSMKRLKQIEIFGIPLAPSLVPELKSALPDCEVDCY